MALRLLRRQLTPLNHQLHHRVVGSDAGDAVGINVVGAAVAHIKYLAAPARDQARHQGRAHAVKLSAELGVFKHGDVRQRHRAAKHPFRLLRRHFGGKGALDLLREHLAGQTAGNFAGLGTSHAVADDGKQGVVPEAFHTERVLIFFSDIARVSQTPSLHGRHSFPVSVSYFLRSCPQEALMSPPRVLRTVAGMPWASSRC